jgi:hypothetical protein
VVPDVGRVIGKRACRMLDAGVKIEVDAFLTAVRGPFLNELMRRIGDVGPLGPRQRRRLDHATTSARRS